MDRHLGLNRPEGGGGYGEHSSQIKNPEGLLERIHSRHEEQGKSPGYQYAEGFPRASVPVAGLGESVQW